MEFVLLAWLGSVIAWRAVADATPWSPPGGHPTRCRHTRMTCACVACSALIAGCARCQKRLAKTLPRDAHGRWTARRSRPPP